MNWFNYQHLYYFYMIAREGGVAKAATKLRLGQPTLSTQLKQFETALGHQLFERVNRSMQLTETGKVVYDYAEEIFRLGSEMVETINDKRGDHVTHLQIGALDSVPKAIIEQLLAAANRISECYVSLLEGPTDFLLRELMAHRIDLVITNSPAPIAPKTQCHSRLIAEMPVVVFGARDFHKLKQGFPKSLEAQPFVLPTTHSKLRSDIEHFFDTKKIKIRPIIETQDTSLQQLIVQSGKALAAMAEPAFTSLGGENKLAILGQLPVKEQLWLSSASRRIKNPIASELMEHFKLN
jgi:LysR family transcriptional regulator, transcriptional activator of nhaA